jgi:undecaprenyl-diphosphatase
LPALKNHPSSTDFAARYFVGGAIIFIAMTLVLAKISEDVVNQEPLTVADIQLSKWLHVHAFLSMTRFLWVVTSLHSTVVVSVAAVIFGLYLLSRRQPYWFAAAWLSIFGGMLLNKILKFAFHRARPHFDDPILTLTSYSFPSGHTMMATVLYGTLAAYVVINASERRWRVIASIIAGLMIVLVGFSRIYLGAHYLSDVLAAIAEGLAWISLVLTGVYAVWQKWGNQRRSG